MAKKNSLNHVILWGVGIVAFLAVTGKKAVEKLTARQRFLAFMKPVADVIKNRYGVDPVITIGQAAHESNWGQSELTALANNLYGFTGDAWKKEGKPVVEIPTVEYRNEKQPDGSIKSVKYVTKRPFRKYDSWESSVNDWANLITTLSRYSKAYAAAKVSNTDGFAHEVQAGGYATDPVYATKLVGVFKAVKEAIV